VSHGYHTELCVHSCSWSSLLVLTGEQDLHDVLSTTIEVAARWKFIGDTFRLSDGTLEIIRADCSDSKACLQEVISKWLRKSGYDSQQYGSPTWRWVVEAVASPAGGDNPELARRIAAQHPKGTYMLLADLCPFLHMVSEVLVCVCDVRHS